MRGFVGAEPADKSLGRGVAWINHQRLLQQPNRLVHALGGTPVAQGQRAQAKIVGVEALGRLAADTLELSLA